MHYSRQQAATVQLCEQFLLGPCGRSCGAAPRRLSGWSRCGWSRCGRGRSPDACRSGPPEALGFVQHRYPADGGQGEQVQGTQHQDELRVQRGSFLCDAQRPHHRRCVSFSCFRNCVSFSCFRNCVSFSCFRNRDSCGDQRRRVLLRLRQSASGRGVHRGVVRRSQVGRPPVVQEPRGDCQLCASHADGHGVWRSRLLRLHPGHRVPQL